MLVISRKKGESLLIGDDIEITVEKIDTSSVKISIKAPKEKVILRKEVYEKVKNENLSFLEGVRLGTFTVPGDGCIDFDPIFKVLEDAGYEGYMLVEAEQDPAKANPLEYAIKARKFIAEKTGL